MDKQIISYPLFWLGHHFCKKIIAPKFLDSKYRKQMPSQKYQETSTSRKIGRGKIAKIARIL